MSGNTADETELARAIVLRALARRARSRGFLYNRLVDRGTSREIAETLLDRFEEVGLINDEQLAHDLTASLHHSRGLARRFIAKELHHQGLQEHHIEAAIAQISDDNEALRAEQLAHTRMRRLQNLERPIQERRLASFLARKGYEPGLVWDVVRSISTAAPK